MQIDKDTLLSCRFCGCLPDGYEGRQVSCRCGAMGPIETKGDPESATWNTRAPIDKDTLRAALEGAVKPLEWTRGIVDYAMPILGMKYVACSTTPMGSWAWWIDGGPRGVEKSEAKAKAAAQADYTARILSAIDLDALAAKLGGGE